MNTLSKAFFLFLVHCVSVTAQELPTPAEIKQHLHRWHDDFVAFRIGYEQTWPGAPDVRSHREFTLTDTKDYYDFDDWFKPNEAPFRRVNGGNAEGRFIAGYRLNSETQEWDLTGVTDLPRINDHAGAPMLVQPLWPQMMSFGHWLDEYPLADLTVEGYEDVDGEECVRVRFLHPVLKSDFTCLAWLVPAKGFVVKKSTPGPQNNRRFAYYICDKFQYDGKRWFPQQGRFGDERPDYYHMNWEVTKFEVNPILPRILFIAPDDSMVRKRRAEAAKKSRALNQQSQQLSPAAREPPPAAIPRSWGRVSWVMVVLTCSVLLAVSLYYRFAN